MILKRGKMLLKLGIMILSFSIYSFDYKIFNNDFYEKKYTDDYYNFIEEIEKIIETSIQESIWISKEMELLLAKIKSIRFEEYSWNNYQEKKKNEFRYLLDRKNINPFNKEPVIEEQFFLKKEKFKEIFSLIPNQCDNINNKNNYFDKNQNYYHRKDTLNINLPDLIKIFENSKQICIKIEDFLNSKF